MKRQPYTPLFTPPAPGAALGSDLPTRIMASIDATMLRIERKPGATFA